MAKVALTEKQRRKQRYERRSRVLADGLAAHKSWNRLTNDNLAEELEIGKGTVAKLLCGGEVKISTMTFWRLLEIAGLEVKQREAAV